MLHTYCGLGHHVVVNSHGNPPRALQFRGTLHAEAHRCLSASAPNRWWLSRHRHEASTLQDQIKANCRATQVTRHPGIATYETVVDAGLESRAWRHKSACYKLQLAATTRFVAGHDLPSIIKCLWLSAHQLLPDINIRRGSHSKASMIQAGESTGGLISSANRPRKHQSTCLPRTKPLQGNPAGFTSYDAFSI